MKNHLITLGILIAIVTAITGVGLFFYLIGPKVSAILLLCLAGFAVLVVVYLVIYDEVVSSRELRKAERKYRWHE